ncbi:MAG: hypothetical protein R3E79_51275 [Caldilineaceae bacterium]
MSAAYTGLLPTDWLAKATVPAQLDPALLWPLARLDQAVATLAERTHLIARRRRCTVGKSTAR